MKYGQLSVWLASTAIAISAATNVAADVSSGYLAGVWAPEEQKNCASPEAEQLIFRADGTFESRRQERVESIGFWRKNPQEGEDVVTLHLLTSPEFLDERLKQFQGHFEYFPVKVLLFNMEENSFEVFGLIGHQIKREKVFRCR